MTDRPTQAPSWVGDAAAALPDELEDDQLAAFMLTIIGMYRDAPRDVIPLLVSLPLTYAMAVGLPLEILHETYVRGAEGVEKIMAEETGRMN